MLVIPSKNALVSTAHGVRQPIIKHISRIARGTLLTLIGTTASHLAVAEDDVAPLVSNPTLASELANALALTAYQECTARGHRVAVAVVARDGRLVAFLRHPDAGPHTIKVAERKAWTANTFRTNTTTLQSRPTRNLMRDIPNALLIGGGIPINLAGRHLGAVGVSGAPAEKTPGDIDDTCALAGIEAIATDVEMAE